MVLLCRPPSLKVPPPLHFDHLPPPLTCKSSGLEAWGEAAEVLKPLKGGLGEEIPPPLHRHPATAPNSSQENRPQTEDYKSPQPRQAAGTLWFVAAGWRPEVFVFVNRNGERQEGKARGMGTPRQNWKLPAFLPLLRLSSVRWALKMELGGCVLVCPLLLSSKG